MKFNFKWHIDDRELSPEERRGVLEDLFVFGKANKGPYLVRMSILLLLSTIIASAGLLSDSAAVVIGAMLVAPMMNPVMAAAAAVVMGWSPRFYGAIWLVLSMGIGAILLSMMITALSPEIVFIPEQVLARTRPTFYDLLIALAAGSAGAYTITRKESGAIPGVAVAVALLPPLASSGILIVAAQYELAVRAVVLFLVNLVAMVLAGALTFIAVGVSPAAARRRSHTFIRNQLWLFCLLVLAISIPLYFYSEKIIFNAHYRAAQSDTLQHWLKDNDLTLTDVDILLKDREIFLALEGPNPPVNIKALHDGFSQDMRARGQDVPFSIRYTWTQKVDGVWPLQGREIEDLLVSDREQLDQLLANDWKWQFTQYDANRASRPAGEDYILRFEEKGKFSVAADCGTKKGKYNIRGRTIGFEMKRFNWFRCNDEDILEVFLADLGRGTDFFVEGGELRISLVTDSGIIYFEKYP
jgi:uncharacterized hydrophobic protein (TIGR00271 family)